jgi:D-glycero-D-manno-heptose 1,7-bisphosphate phosphatase
VSRRVVFLDRDGTLNEEVNYLHDPRDLRMIEGSATAIARLNRAGRAVVVVSNQAGVARGYFPESSVALVHEAISALLAREGARVDAYYYCPHHPEITGPCGCRKPGTDLFLRAERELGLTLEGAWMIGDSTTDLEAGFALGLRTALVLTGYGKRTLLHYPTPDGRAPSLVRATLAEAIDALLQEP